MCINSSSPNPVKSETPQVKAFSLLVLTVESGQVRFFVRKSRVNSGRVVSTGSENAEAGKPVVLANERKAVPTFSVTFAIAGDVLTGQGTGQPPFTLMHQGVKEGHPRFFLPEVGAEIDFVPDAVGGYPSIVLHEAGHDTPGEKMTDSHEPLETKMPESLTAGRHSMLIERRVTASWQLLRL